MTLNNKVGDITWAEWHDMAVSAYTSGRKELADKLYPRAMEAASNRTESLHTSAMVAISKVKSRHDLPEVIKILEEKADSENGNIANWLNLATAYNKVPNPQAALVAAINGYMIDQKNPDILSTMSTCYGMLGDYQSELTFLEQAAAVDKTRIWAAAMVRMKSDKDFVRFSKEYATRPKPISGDSLRPIDITKPGKVLVAMEQGLGDLIMVGRAFGWLESLGFDVTFHCSSINTAEVCALMKHGVSVSNTKSLEFRRSEFDYVVNLMDLLEFRDQWSKPWSNGIFGGYLSSKYKCNSDSRFDGKIGVNFEGNPDFEFEHCRGVYDENVRLSILESGNTVDLSLHKSDRIAKFQDKIARLKGVITTDTMIAHMSAAMGLPTLVLLATNCDWRWYHSWYGDHVSVAMQDKIGNWSSVLPDVKEFMEKYK